MFDLETILSLHSPPNFVVMRQSAVEHVSWVWVSGLGCPAYIRPLILTICGPLWRVSSAEYALRRVSGHVRRVRGDMQEMEDVLKPLLTVREATAECTQRAVYGEDGVPLHMRHTAPL